MMYYNNEVKSMPIIYDKLFKLYEERGITTYTIRKNNIMSQSALTKMKNATGSIDTRTIEKLCMILECQPGDIMEYIPDED